MQEELEQAPSGIQTTWLPTGVMGCEKCLFSGKLTFDRESGASMHRVEVASKHRSSLARLPVKGE